MMKFNFVLSTIAVALLALIAYAFYMWCADSSASLLLALGGGITMCSTLLVSLAGSFKRKRTSVNVKVISGIFSSLFLVSNIVFCFVNTVSNPTYILVNGLIFIIWILIVYSIYKSMNE